MRKIKILLFTAGIFLSYLASASITLPSVFSNNMVLQQKTDVAIWGKAKPNTAVNITASWSKKAFQTKSDAYGNWKVKIPTISFGGPYQITISDGAVLKLSNVMLGDVWVCSGQSNMEMPLAGWGKINNYQQEIDQANYPNIRLLQVNQVASNDPLNDAAVANSGWTICNPKHVELFSATAYFFAREVYKQTGIPIGLIHTSWGGTIAEAWTSASTLKNFPDFAPLVTKITNKQSRADYVQELALWNRIVLENDAGYKNGKPVWLNEEVKDQDWKTMQLPAFFDQSVFPDLDGIVYFRKKITIPAAWKGKDLKLNLGTIDDNDVTYFNGVKVGETEGYNQNRIYTIPADLVKTGENVIAVRVFDSGGGGGIYGTKNILSLQLSANDKISLDGDWKYNLGLDFKKLPAKPSDFEGANRPTVLYNAMIHPFINFTIKGVIWYQGESNAERANQYRTLFPALITDWRQAWQLGDFPFYYVQLAGFKKHEDEPKEADWAELRDAQSGALKLKNTGMAVAIDIGNAEDIHPKNKQEIGRRLALIALAKTYGKVIAFSGPALKSFVVDNSKIILDFNYAQGGLKTLNNKPLKGFAIAGEDHKFCWAKAEIVGNQVILSSPDVIKPVAIRYGWASNPESNLYNKVGLPASPFKTDNWEDTTKGVK